jgi:hypothetical protein
MNIDENVRFTNVLSQIARLIESVSPVSNSSTMAMEGPSTSTGSTSSTRQHGSTHVSGSEFQVSKYEQLNLSTT